MPSGGLRAALAGLSRQPLNKREVDHGNLVRDVEVRVEALLPCQGGEALLRQVWVNPLSNGLKYTRRREAALVEVGCASGRRSISCATTGWKC